MKAVEIRTIEYACQYCNRTFKYSIDCKTHEEFCQSSDPARALAERLTALIKYAATQGVQITASCSIKRIGGAEFDECNGIIELLPADEI